MEKHKITCEQVQLYLTENDATGTPATVSDHLKSCHNCRAYAAAIQSLHTNLSVQESKNHMEPDPQIKERLQKRFQKDRSQSKVWPIIKHVVEYRIPVYQLVAAAAVFFVVFFMFDSIPEPGIEMLPVEAQHQIMVAPELAQISLLDSLNLERMQNVGRNALEDSAITKYLVGAM